MAEAKAPAFRDVHITNRAGGARTLHTDAGSAISIASGESYQGKILEADYDDLRSIGFRNHDESNATAMDKNVLDADLDSLDVAGLMERARVRGYASLAEQGGLFAKDFREAIRLAESESPKVDDDQDGDQGGDATVGQLTASNSRDALVELAKSEGVEHEPNATKTEIAQAIVDKRAA